jgi:uncharacterized protein
VITVTSPLPAFRHHPDPLGSGSISASDAKCACCKQSRGYLYEGPVYGEEDEVPLCPWCIHDGSAHEKLDVTFVDSEAFDDDASAEAMDLICERTPGFNAWQGERWPSCCGAPAAFVTPAGAEEIRTKYPRLEGPLMTYIVHDMSISGGAARRLLDSLQKDQSPTAFIFKCLHCDNMPVYVDRL